MKTNIFVKLAATLEKMSLQLAAISNVKAAPMVLEHPSLTKRAPLPSPRAAKKEKALSDKVYKKLKNGGRALGVEKPVVMPRGVQNHLTPEQTADIAVLLTKSELSIAEIAALYNKTKPTIYSIGKKLGLTTHKASPALLAGVARRKARLLLEKEGLKLNSLAPFPHAGAAQASPAPEEKAKKEASAP